MGWTEAQVATYNVNSAKVGFRKIRGIYNFETGEKYVSKAQTARNAIKSKVGYRKVYVTCNVKTAKTDLSNV